MISFGACFFGGGSNPELGSPFDRTICSLAVLMARDTLSADTSGWGLVDGTSPSLRFVPDDNMVTESRGWPAYSVRK